MSYRSLGFFVGLLIAITIPLWDSGVVQAQSISYGKLTGTIMNDDGEGIAGVQVEITSDALISGKRTTNTSANGTYIFQNLPVGTYRVTASGPGFAMMVRDNVELSAGAVATVDLTMQMGAVEESITVTEAFPVVDRKNSAVNTSFDEETIQRLPTAREPFYDLTLTAPGMFRIRKWCE
jgi:Carboxypeptidase regulatory-like domain